MNKLLPVLLLLFGCLSLQSGCSEPEIVRHRVPKDRSGLEKLRNANAPVVDSAPVVKTKMVVAIFDEPEATWFFKISGPTQQVDETESLWSPFLKSVTFEEGQPKWELPGDWRNAGPKPMRHATLVIGKTNPPLEIAISDLAPNQDLLLNVNRWRGQIGLAPSEQSELDSQITKIDSEGEQFLLFAAEGTGSGQMTPPFAGGGRPPMQSQRGAPFAGGGGGGIFGGGTPGSKKLGYDSPVGWSEGQTSSIVHARLTKKDGDAEVQITIVEMPADANEWEPNVKRWADQVGLGNLSAEEFTKRTTELIVDGVTGQLVDLVDLDSESPTATVAGMVKRDGSAWFLKLSGDKQLTETSRGEFKKFLASLKFK